MSYRILAWKWRPKNFEEIVGQEHVIRALRSALSQRRMHHTYLFSGTTGVGKTTIAKILAKSLNWETGIPANPCGKYDTYLEIDSVRFITDTKSLLQKLEITGAAQVLLEHCVVTKNSNNEIEITLDPLQAPLLTKKQEERISAAINKYYNRPVT